MGKEKVKELLQSYLESKGSSSMTEDYLNNVSKWIIETCKIIKDKYDNNPDNMFKGGKYKAPLHE